jgi:hypothetical protein
MNKDASNVETPGANLREKHFFRNAMRILFQGAGLRNPTIGLRWFGDLVPEFEDEDLLTNSWLRKRFEGQFL